MITTQCPAAASLPTITLPKCTEDFGQIQKVVFQRLYNNNGQRNVLPSSGTEGILKLSVMQAYLTNNDSTKIVVSPYIEAPTTEAGDARTSGGGNDSLNGIETIVGTNPTTFNGVIRSQSQAVIKAMKLLMGEAKAHNLGVYLVNENGQYGCIDTSTILTGTVGAIPVENLFIGDKSFGGLEAPDENAISWSFRPNYSDDFKVVTPNYNPLTDLIPAQQ